MADFTHLNGGVLILEGNNIEVAISIEVNMFRFEVVRLLLQHCAHITNSKY
jgi:hypothetical protein